MAKGRKGDPKKVFWRAGGGKGDFIWKGDFRRGKGLRGEGERGEEERPKTLSFKTFAK